MEILTPPSSGYVRIALQPDEALHVLHPKAIVAFQGRPGQREDRLLDMADMYRKRKWINARLAGPSLCLIGLPPGFSLSVVDIEPGGDLLFDFRHVLFYTEGIAMRSRIQRFRSALITRDLVRMRFSGPGKLGVVTGGGMASLALHPDVPSFVEAGSLVAFPESAAVRLSVYGNPLASQHMRVQWELRGRGPALVQGGTRDPGLAGRMSGDGLFKRLLRELLPFGSVYIK